MAEQKKTLTGRKFLREILTGRTDFSGISLLQATNLSSYPRLYRKVNDFLLHKNLEKYPINLENSSMISLIAPNLYLPHVRASGSTWQGAVLADSVFSYGDFSQADFSGTNLTRVSLDFTNLVNAEVYGTIIDGTQIFGAKGLESLKGIDRMVLKGEFFIDNGQEEFIRRILENRFKVVDHYTRPEEEDK